MDISSKPHLNTSVCNKQNQNSVNIFQMHFRQQFRNTWIWSLLVLIFPGSSLVPFIVPCSSLVHLIVPCSSLVPLIVPCSSLVPSQYHLVAHKQIITFAERLVEEAGGVTVSNRAQQAVGQLWPRGKCSRDNCTVLFDQLNSRGQLYSFV